LPHATILNSNFFRELGRRKVFRVAGAYAVVGWLVIQITATVVPALHLPDAITTAIVLLTLVGFPIALVLAWAFDVTPRGIEQTGAARPDESARSTRNLWALGIAGLVIAALAGAAFFRWQRPVAKTAATNAAQSLASPAPAATATGEGDSAMTNLKSLAVLPFVNMSGDPKNDYFSDGITEEILNAVSHLLDLRVASSTSAFAFKGKSEDVASIAAILHVATVLEGSVQREGDRVRVTAQLIDAKSGFHIWSKKFDCAAKDLFAVEDEISQAIADALKLALGVGGKHNLQRSGTENVAAHEAYLKATEAHEKGDEQLALKYVNEAITLDPKFALAYARKAKTLSTLAFTSSSDAAFQQYGKEGEAAAKRAVELDPNLAEAHSALGEIARRLGDVRTAAENFRRAANLKPADPEAWHGLGFTLIESDPKAALGYLQKAKVLGDTSLVLERLISFALDALGKGDEAHAAMLQLHEPHPDFIPAYVDLGNYEFWMRGRPDQALALFVQGYRKEPNFTRNGVPITFYPAMAYALSRDLPRAHAWLDREAAAAPDSLAVLVTQYLLLTEKGDMAKAAPFIDRLRQISTPSKYFIPFHLLIAGDVALLAGDFASAEKNYRVVLEAFGSGDPGEPLAFRNVKVHLAYALRKLGGNAEATALLQSAHAMIGGLARYSIRKSMWFQSTGCDYAEAEVHAMSGEKEKALAALNTTLNLPDDGLILIGSLPVAIEDSPLLETLRDMPGFAAFRKEVARRRSIMKTRVQAVSDQLERTAN